MALLFKQFLIYISKSPKSVTPLQVCNPSVPLSALKIIPLPVKFFEVGRLQQSVLALLCIAFVIIVLLTQVDFAAGFNDGDSISHYRIAHWSWVHPMLFLDNWGKPLFTLLCSPFAQFGTTGGQIFNLLCCIASCWITYLLASKLQLRYAWLVPLFVAFAPVYYTTVVTVLTEILFGLVLVWSVYLVAREKYTFAAILVSFLPFCRSEGYLLLPLFALAFLLFKKYKDIPWLASGTLVYSIIDSFAHSDFLWVFHKNPYTAGGENIYGHGTFTHFFDATKGLAGIPLTFAFIVGLLFCIYALVKRRQAEPENKRTAILFILVFGCCLTYFMAHVIFWWKGLFGSFGMFRVMAAIMPLWAVGALFGINAFTDAIKFPTWLKLLFALFFTVIVVQTPFKVFAPQKEDAVYAVLRRSLDAFKPEYQQQHFYYTNPYTALYLHLDMDATNSSVLKRSAGIALSKTIKKGSLIEWDSDFANHSMVPLDSVLNSIEYTVLRRDSLPSKHFTLLILQKK